MLVEKGIIKEPAIQSWTVLGGNTDADADVPIGSSNFAEQHCCCKQTRLYEAYFMGRCWVLCRLNANHQEKENPKILDGIQRTIKMSMELKQTTVQHCRVHAPQQHTTAILSHLNNLIKTSVRDLSLFSGVPKAKPAHQRLLAARSYYMGEPSFRVKQVKHGPNRRSSVRRFSVSITSYIDPLIHQCSLGSLPPIPQRTSNLSSSCRPCPALL